jgi:hypothetical protein
MDILGSKSSILLIYSHMVSPINHVLGIYVASLRKVVHGCFKARIDKKK